MQLTETITIINKSGKIIGNRDHFLDIFKDAKAAYQEKKASLLRRESSSLNASAQLPIPGHLRKSHTLAAVPQHSSSSQQNERQRSSHARQIEREQGCRSPNDDQSLDTASRRSPHDRKTHRSRPRKSHDDDASDAGSERVALTSRNLEALSKASSVASSQPQTGYRSPYAETSPRDTVLSRQTLVRAKTLGDMEAMTRYKPTSMANYKPAQQSQDDSSQYTAIPPYPGSQWQPILVNRQASDPSMRIGRARTEDIDMRLAYGNIPPDLAHRVDLDPAFQEASREAQARSLMSTIDKLILEAKCLHHTANGMIEGLQKDPEKAAAVALTLGELSTVLSKLSPGFLSVVQSGFPHVFALLASPQFLVGVGAVVGVTVVCFGGWKIVKRIKTASDSHRAKEAALAWQGQMSLPQQGQPQLQQHPWPPPYSPPPYYMPSLADHQGHRYEQVEPYNALQPTAPSVDDAIVLDDEMSTIESWRRGIPVPDGDESTIDFEIMTPSAVRSRQEDRHRRRHRHRDVRDDSTEASTKYEEANESIADTASQSTKRTANTARTARTSASHRSGHSSSTDRHRRHRSADEDDMRSNNSESTVKASKISSGHRAEVRTLRGDQEDDLKSTKSGRTHRSSRSRHTAVQAIEDGSRAGDDTLQAVLGGSVKSEKKGNLLKALFKKDGDKSSLSLVSRK